MKICGLCNRIHSLSWLQSHFWIRFKVLILIYKTLIGPGLSCIRPCVQVHLSRQLHLQETLYSRWILFKLPEPAQYHTGDAAKRGPVCFSLAFLLMKDRRDMKGVSRSRESRGSLCQQLLGTLDAVPSSCHWLYRERYNPTSDLCLICPATLKGRSSSRPPALLTSEGGTWLSGQKGTNRIRWLEDKELLGTLPIRSVHLQPPKRHLTNPKLESQILHKCHKEMFCSKWPETNPVRG